MIGLTNNTSRVYCSLQRGLSWCSVKVTCCVSSLLVLALPAVESAMFRHVYALMCTMWLLELQRLILTVLSQCTTEHLLPPISNNKASEGSLTALKDLASVNGQSSKRSLLLRRREKECTPDRVPHGGGEESMNIPASSWCIPKGEKGFLQSQKSEPFTKLGKGPGSEKGK